MVNFIVSTLGEVHFKCGLNNRKVEFLTTATKMLAGFIIAYLGNQENGKIPSRIKLMTWIGTHTQTSTNG